MTRRLEKEPSKWRNKDGTSVFDHWLIWMVVIGFAVIGFGILGSAGLLWILVSVRDWLTSLW